MWRTSCGDRTLEGAEARLFAEALLSLLDQEISLRFESCPLGIECYDSLTYGQRISVLSRVADGLLREDAPAVPLTTVAKGAVAAVFEHLRSLVEINLDEPAWWRDWRASIVAARRERGAADIPDPACDDLRQWEVQIQALRDMILWDADYEELYVDKRPQESDARRARAGISLEREPAVACDLSDKQIEARISGVRKVCRFAVEKS